MTRLSLALLSSISIGLSTSFCGGVSKQPQMVQETSFVSDSASNPSIVPTEPVGAAPVVKGTSHLPGTLRRSDLLRLLDKGPGALLSMVETEPYRENGKFVGFKIVRFIQDSQGAVDLRPGDVILSVNGLAIVTPDDFYRIFQELKATSEIRFEVLRDHMKVSSAYPVVE